MIQSFCAAVFLFAFAVVSMASPAVAQPASQQSSGGGVSLDSYLSALEHKGLISREAGSADKLRDEVGRADQLYLDQRYDDAALMLYDAVESPRFADFHELPEYVSAEVTLASCLQHMGALRTASRYLLRVIKRGPDDNNYFGPAFRKYVDVTLAWGDIAQGIKQIEALGLSSLPEDAQNEMRYLHGRLAYDAEDFAAAESALSSITKKSRFYANAQYLRGVIDAVQGRMKQAEDRFCSIASTKDQNRFTFYVDDRYFKIKDLAWLALGRVAHEQGRADDAFYYYFQVPQDSPRVAEALFEGAFAMYEGGDPDTALDLLDQLAAHFPHSPFVDEAQLLRGYVHLDRCEFDQANRLFEKFEARFGPMLAEIDRILGSPARQGRLYEDLLAEQRRASEAGKGGEAGAPEGKSLLLALLSVDPTFYQLHGDINTLDAEAARSSRLETEVRAIEARLRGGERPRAVAREKAPASDAQALQHDIDAGRAVLSRMTEQLDVMRRGGAKKSQLQPLEQQLRDAGRRLSVLEGKLRAAEAQGAGAQEGEGESAAPEQGDVQALLRHDLVYTHRLPARVAAVRAKLVQAANGAALRALRKVRARVARELRRARIGRIDAVMGSKRRIEIQIESLAAGRFPPELQDPLRVQGLLRDDEEYWPFEGEYWSDEFTGTAPSEGGKSKR